MNRTNSTIILAAITLGIFLVFNTITTPMITNVSAEPTAEGYVNEEQSHMDYPPEKENDYYSSKPPEYNPERYGGYYGHYEGDFYLDQYVDGNPYNDNSNPYENGSPYERN